MTQKDGLLTVSQSRDSLTSYHCPDGLFSRIPRTFLESPAPPHSFFFFRAKMDDLDTKPC